MTVQSSYSYNDKVTWYFNDGLLTSEVELFADVRSVYTPATAEQPIYEDYATLRNKFSSASLPAFSVERSSEDEIVLTCRFNLGSPTTQSIALIVGSSSNPYLIGRIDKGNPNLPTLQNSVDRVFRLKLPYREIGGLKVYPNIKVRAKKFIGSPLGEELVTVGEHHHSVEWGSGENDRDRVPILNSARSRYVASADYGTQDSFSGTSYVFNESGSLSTKVASITGALDGRTDLDETFVSRIITDLFINNLANVMEEYLMATNSIQILGHAIPVDQSRADFDKINGGTDSAYILYANRVDATDDRKLRAIPIGIFKDFLVTYVKPENSIVNTTACVTVTKSGSDIRVNLNSVSQLCFVTNSNPDTSTTDITISYGDSNGIKDVETVAPSDTIAILKTPDLSEASGVAYNVFSVGSMGTIQRLRRGDLGFSKITFMKNISDTTSGISGQLIDATSGEVDVTIADTIIKKTLTVNETTTLDKALTVVSGGAAITGDSSVDGTLSTTGNSTIGGTLSVTGTTTLSDKLTVSSGGAEITGNSSVIGSFSATSYVGDITLQGTVTATKFISTEGFFIA